MDPRDVWLQSFNKDDVLYWMTNAPEFGRQAVYLDDVDPTADPAGPAPDPRRAAAAARPGRALLRAADAGAAGGGRQQRSGAVAVRAGHQERGLQHHHLDLRALRPAPGRVQAGFYYYFDPQGKAMKKDSDMYKALDALAQQVSRRDLLRLAGHRDLLRELHGVGVELLAIIGSQGQADIRSVLARHRPGLGHWTIDSKSIPNSRGRFPYRRAVLT